MVYHFTTLGYLPLIRESGFLKTEIKMDREGVRNIRCAVWFTRRAEPYDPSALKCLPIPPDFARASSFEAQCKFMTAVRLTLPDECAPLSWMQYAKQSGITRKGQESLEQRALEWGTNVNYFRASFEDIPIEKIVSTDVWAGKWQAFTGQEVFTKTDIELMEIVKKQRLDGVIK